MTCHCGVNGQSARAIAAAFANPCGPTDYPRDPDDLGRCRAYCDDHGITPAMLSDRMRGVSPQWAALTAEWPELLRMLDEERPSGRAPRTYARMRGLIESAGAPRG